MLPGAGDCHHQPYTIGNIASRLFARPPQRAFQQPSSRAAARYSCHARIGFLMRSMTLLLPISSAHRSASAGWQGGTTTRRCCRSIIINISAHRRADGPNESELATIVSRNAMSSIYIHQRCCWVPRTQMLHTTAPSPPLTSTPQQQRPAFVDHQLRRKSDPAHHHHRPRRPMIKCPARTPTQRAAGAYKNRINLTSVRRSYTTSQPPTDTLLTIVYAVMPTRRWQVAAEPARASGWHSTSNKTPVGSQSCAAAPPADR